MGQGVEYTGVGKLRDFLDRNRRLSLEQYETGPMVTINDRNS